ncbi:hypothetical protein LXA43DRAFT_1179489 [Ganoderma leucocontextum]|nr:hypothetical protein LXA43DRAFT_1179489 [Ganoderma leucocontextum]
MFIGGSFGQFRPAATSCHSAYDFSFVTLGVLALSTFSAVYATPKPVPVQLHISGIRRRALDAIGVPLDDLFLGTDLQWFGNISGAIVVIVMHSCEKLIRRLLQRSRHPFPRVSVVFDTGSQTLEFAETGCKSCTQTGKFNPSKSSTFKRGTRKHTLPFATGVGVDPVVDNNYVLTIQSATDSATVGGITLDKVSLFTIIDQTAAFNVDPFLGI